MILKIDHLGIATADAAQLRRVYEDLLGLGVQSTDGVASQKVRATFYPCDTVRFELLESTDPNGPIARFLEKRGEGFHHVAFEVDDVAKELARAKTLGFELIDERPRPGAHGTLVGFLHPKSTHGLLIEFVQHPRSSGHAR